MAGNGKTSVYVGGGKQRGTKVVTGGATTVKLIGNHRVQQSGPGVMKHGRKGMGC